ncbi:MAG: TolC family protein [Paludibacteraceae bacterium]|nr:TolC family protein [Paludibacteraceae bacterium]
MKTYCRYILVLLVVAMPLWGRELTLEQCREMALSAKQSQAGEELKEAAKDNRRAAAAAMFPRVSANSAYTWTNAKLTLLPSEMDLGSGRAIISQAGAGHFFWNEGSPMGQLVQQTKDIDIVGNQVQSLANASGQMIADGYKQIYDQLNLNTTHLFVAQVGVTQPIYVGGRLSAIYDMSKLAEQTIELEADKKHDDLIVSVDEAYWRVVSVARKKELAEQYYDLLCKLEGDVKEAVNEGVATQSDLLKVTAKRGEAEMKKLQAENGLKLSKMALAQLCGLPLDEPLDLDESELSETLLQDTAVDIESSVDGRVELQMLEKATEIAKANTKLVSAGLQPSIMANANYIYSNISAENGLYTDWRGKGFFTAGVAVNIPIVHADDIYRLKAAKHAARAAQLKEDETRELLVLQTTQASQKMTEAQQKIVLARLNLANAAEVLRMAQESYDAEMIPASDLMMAQTAWLSAATDLVDAEAEAKTTETLLRKYLRKL